jgi:hypothetical protein
LAAKNDKQNLYSRVRKIIREMPAQRGEVTIIDRILKENGSTPKQHEWLATCMILYAELCNKPLRLTWMPQAKNKIWRQYTVKFAAVMELDRDVSKILTDTRHSGDDDKFISKEEPTPSWRLLSLIGGQIPKMRDSSYDHRDSQRSRRH